MEVEEDLLGRRVPDPMHFQSARQDCGIGREALLLGPSDIRLLGWNCEPLFLCDGYPGQDMAKDCVDEVLVSCLGLHVVCEWSCR